MATAFDSALSYKALSNAWAKLYSKTKPISRNTIGVDDKSINDFQIDAKGNLVRLHKLLSSGEFKFSALKPYLIPKANGKKRLICVPTVGDRIVQGAVLDFLSTKYTNVLANSVSFGFIKGVGVSQAAKRARELRDKHPYVFKTDITSFFDSIPRTQLTAAIKRVVRDRSLHPILFEALSCEVAYNQKNLRDIDALGIKPGRGLRQGMPLSPFLSNLLLVKFDRSLDKTGLKAVRYADDLIFLCDDEIECRRAAQFCEQEFAKIGLSIPEIGPGSKSQIFKPNESAEFLGLELALNKGCYVLRASKNQIDRMRQAILDFSNIRDVVSRGISLRTVNQVLASKRDGFLGAYVDCDNYQEVEHALRQAEVRALKILFGQGLGINIMKIGAVGRTFLGIAD
jgi:retron-type reverse transcriptase